MIDDYISKFYLVLEKRNKSLCANNFEKARRIVAWKKNIVRNWDSIEIRSLKVKTTTSPTIGDVFDVDAIVDTKNLNDSGIGFAYFVQTNYKIPSLCKNILFLDNSRTRNLFYF